MSGGFIGVIIVAVVIGGIATVVVSYLQLQRHRADAVAMASYRKLAEQAVAVNEQLHADLTGLAESVKAVEALLRDVG